MSEGNRGPGRPSQAAPVKEPGQGANGSANRPTPPPPGVRLADPAAIGAKPSPAKPNPAQPNPAQQGGQVPPAGAPSMQPPKQQTAFSPGAAPAKPSTPGVAPAGRPDWPTMARPGGPATSEIPAVAPIPAASPEAKPAAAETLETEAKPKVGAARRTRKARLRLSRLDPWSVMKTSFLFSIAAGIMLVVAVYVVWTVIGQSGLFDQLNEMVKMVVSTPGDTTPFQIQDYINTNKVMGITALLACIDVVIITALSTLGSFLYNLAATMLGGLEVTLAED